MIQFIGTEAMGKRLKELRGRKTIREVAEACLITTSALGNYESGFRIPRDEVKARLANYYGLTIDELFFSA